MRRYADRLPGNFKEAEKALKGKHVRTLLNNTRASRVEDGAVEVQYHGNTIATFYPDGTRVLTTCGWNTVSTSERLNGMLWGDHIAFAQRDHVGYIEVSFVGGDREKHHADTIEIAPDGSIHSITNSREG